jgi:hypothetical protein
VLAILGMVLLCAPALAAGTGEKYDLKLNMNEGDMSRYQVTAAGNIKASVPGTPQAIDMPYSVGMVYTQGVTKISAKGNYVLEAQFEKMVAQVAGKSVDTPSNQLPNVTMLVTPKGKILDQKGTETQTAAFTGGQGAGGFGAMMGGLNQNCASFPEGPISIGHTWNTDLSQLSKVFGKTSSKAACKNKFAAVETVAGRTCARIESSVYLPLNVTGEQLGLPKSNDMRFVARFDLTAWYTLATGNLHKAKGKMVITATGKVTDANGVTADVTFSMDFNMKVDEIGAISGGKATTYAVPAAASYTKPTANSTPKAAPKSSVIKTNG